MTGKIKWHYDKKNKQWYANETVAWANDGFHIYKDRKRYYLKEHGRSDESAFKKLSSAKTVANLLRHG